MHGAVHGCTPTPKFRQTGDGRWRPVVVCAVLLLAGCATTSPDPGAAEDADLDSLADTPRVELAYLEPPWLAIAYSSGSGAGRAVEKMQANTAIQAAAGLVGAIDHERTETGTIVCEDGFHSGMVSPEAFLSLGKRLGVESNVTEVDESSVFCEVVVPGAA